MAMENRTEGEINQQSMVGHCFQVQNQEPGKWTEEK